MASIMFRLLQHHSYTIRKHISLAAKFSSSTLSSFQVVYNEFGDAQKVLTGTSLKVDTSLKDNNVLVKMLMAPINPSDINMIEGTYFIRPTLPAVVGNEGVGEVLAVGSKVKSLRVGDWVNPAVSGWGTLRQFAVANETELSKIPNDIPVLGAATLLVNPCTAYRMLKDYVSLQPGDVIIQNGANSAVGQAVIQLGKNWNITTVNIVRNRPNLDALVNDLKALGANHVITEEFCQSKEMKSFLQLLPSEPKLALNCVGGKSSTELLRILARKGVMVTYGGMSRQPIVVPTGALIFKEVQMFGYWNTEWNNKNQGSEAKQNMTTDLCNMMRKGTFHPPPSDLFPLEEYKSAVATATTGFKSKKVVFVIDENVTKKIIQK